MEIFLFIHICINFVNNYALLDFVTNTTAHMPLIYISFYIRIYCVYTELPFQLRLHTDAPTVNYVYKRTQ